MNKIEELYNPDNFRKIGEEVISLLTDHLKSAYRKEVPVSNYQNPEIALKSWTEFMDSDASVVAFFKKVVADSIHLHHPQYLGHQVSAPAPIAAFGGLISDLLNNGMAVYEMGGASSTLEKILCDTLCQEVGLGERAGGFLTSGGTLANFTALLTARRIKCRQDVWEFGSSGLRLGIMVSEQAHYCVDRAARIMGLGSEGVVKLPVNDKFQIETKILDKKLEEAKSQGIVVFAIVASSCSTSTGSYDNLEELSAFAKRNNLWLHVDGAHGGAAVFSSKYKHLVKGIENADSLIIDCHKLMMTPTICTAVLYKERAYSAATFTQRADYLFDESEDFDWWNSGKRTFECTKLMMSIKVMAIVKFSGIGVFEELVDLLYDRAKLFAELIEKDPGFDLALSPQSNIICFRLRGKNINELNKAIRASILSQGKFYLVQTLLNGQVYLRTSIMNPLTKVEHYSLLLEEIKRLGKTVLEGK